MMNRSTCGRSRSVVPRCLNSWPAQTDRKRHRACGPAQGLWNRTRLILGFGTKAASRAKMSSGHIDAAEGRMVVFRSWLRHGVLPSVIDEDRATISFKVTR